MPATTDILRHDRRKKAKRFVFRFISRFRIGVKISCHGDTPHIHLSNVLFWLYRITGLVRRPLKAVIRVRVPLELLCSHAEIGSQASLSRWCP